MTRIELMAKQGVLLWVATIMSARDAARANTKADVVLEKGRYFNDIVFPNGSALSS